MSLSLDDVQVPSLERWKGVTLLGETREETREPPRSGDIGGMTLRGRAAPVTFPPAPPIEVVRSLRVRGSVTKCWLKPAPF